MLGMILLPKRSHGRRNVNTQKRSLTMSSIATWAACGSLIHRHFGGGSSDQSAHTEIQQEQQRRQHRNKKRLNNWCRALSGEDLRYRK